jgi:hypothetical protein
MKKILLILLLMLMASCQIKTVPQKKDIITQQNNKEWLKNYLKR